MGVNIPVIAAGITIFAIISFKFIMGRIVLYGLIVLQRYLNKYDFRTPVLNLSGRVVFDMWRIFMGS